VLDCWP